jgi:Flp pilus assembly protein TadG
MTPTVRRPKSVEVVGRRQQRGQTLVEFALVMPVFLLGVFGIIDGSRLVFLNSTLSQAAREGARQASVEASWLGSTDASCGTPAGPTCPATETVLKTHVVDAVNRMTVPFGNVASTNAFMDCSATTAPTGAWTTSSCTNRTSGSVVSVRVTYTYSPITPVIGQILGTFTLSGSATMVIN